jgi:hypothetical protein
MKAPPLTTSRLLLFPDSDLRSERSRLETCARPVSILDPPWQQQSRDVDVFTCGPRSREMVRQPAPGLADIGLTGTSRASGNWVFARHSVVCRGRAVALSRLSTGQRRAAAPTEVACPAEWSSARTQSEDSERAASPS